MSAILTLVPLLTLLLPAAAHHLADGKFNYFAFGSNLLKERLHHMWLTLENPSAELVGIGALDDYELGFGGQFSNHTWHGYPATIREKPGSKVFGAVWRLNQNDSDSLDRQEGVHLENAGYKRLEVFVHMLTPGESLLTCRTYQLKRDEGPRLPSPQYKAVILAGAKELGLPSDYIRGIEGVATNDYDGPIGVPLSLFNHTI